MDVGVVLSLAATLAVVPADSATIVTERAFLEATLSDVRVTALLDEPLAVARAERLRSATLTNPGASFDREALDGSPRLDTWSLAWAPPLDGRHWLGARAGREGLAAAESRHALARLALRAELREAYAAWALARDAASLGNRLATLVEGLARRAEAQASRGEASSLAARRLRLAAVEVRTEAARLTAESGRAAARVRAWIPALGSNSEPARPSLPPALSDSTAWATSPHLAAIEHDVRRAEAASSLVGRFWALPELSVGRQAVRGEFEDTEGPVYGVRWDVPLFDRRQGDRLEARARLAATRARRDLDAVRLREEFTAARAAYETLRSAAVAAADVEPVVERVLESAGALFEAGESDVTDLLETLRGALGGQAALLEAHRAALQAHRELELAAGRALPLMEGDE